MSSYTSTWTLGSHGGHEEKENGKFTKIQVGTREKERHAIWKKADLLLEINLQQMPAHANTDYLHPSIHLAAEQLVILSSANVGKAWM